MVLNIKDKAILEECLGMASGYVLDFSNSTFSRFFRDFDLNIDDEIYCKYGTSKANRMRAFWDIEDRLTISRILRAMAHDWIYNENCKERVLKIADKIGYTKMNTKVAKEIIRRLVNDRKLSLDDMGDINEILSAYHENDILSKELEQNILQLPYSINNFKVNRSILDTQFTHNGISLRQLAASIQQNQTEQIQHQFGSPQKQTSNTFVINNLKYDVFVSHASEDKEEFVKPLVDALKNNNINAWYDNDEISWGDSIASSINRGLADSRYAIVVLSPNFLNKYWTTTELDTIMSMESVNTQKLLPIFHNISYKEIADQKPIILGHLGIDSNEGIDHIIEQIKIKLA